MSSKKGQLYLIPVTLGDAEINDVIPVNVIAILKELQYLFVENIRTARRFLVKANLKHRIDEIEFFELDKHNKNIDYNKFLKPVENGFDLGIMSEAGCPGVADPGSDLVKAAHIKGFNVIPLVGPNSILLALMASGKNGQNFAFNGYLPIKKGDRIKKIKELETLSRKSNQTQIFMEAPYRNMQLLDDVLTNCLPETKLCIAADITTNNEFIKTQSIKKWKSNIPELHKHPAVFII